MDSKTRLLALTPEAKILLIDAFSAVIQEFVEATSMEVLVTKVLMQS